MALINPCHRGLAYGDGHIQGDGQLGQVVRVVGDDLFFGQFDHPLVREAVDKLAELCKKHNRNWGMPCSGPFCSRQVSQFWLRQILCLS